MNERALVSDFELNTLEDVVYCFTTLERAFIAMGDKRAVFATAYLTITRAMKEQIEAQGFEDNGWVAGYLRGFARLYVDALRAYEAGDMERVPRAWRVAFELGAARKGLVIQHLVLGINAHVNHDLPIALATIGVDPERPRRYDDHTSVNVVLGATLDALQEHVERLYSPVLKLFDRLMGSLDDHLSFAMVKNARENAWQACLQLVEAQNEEEYQLAREKVNEASGELAEIIARPLGSVASLLRSLDTLEEHSPLWLLMRPPRPAQHSDAEEELLPSFDSLDERLEEIVQRYDLAGSEMAVYPAFYRLWLQSLSSALQQETFADPQWVVQLELRCANAYLSALADFEKGDAYQVPHGWLSALYAAYDEQATIPQHMMLSVNARMNHDVPRLIHSGVTGIKGDRDRREDLERWRQLYDTTLEEVGASLVGKYRQAAQLQGINVDFPQRLLDLDFLRDMRPATSVDDLWTVGEQGEEASLEEIALEAAVRANAILARQHISAVELTSALRRIEAQYTGRWSAWI